MKKGVIKRIYPIDEGKNYRKQCVLVEVMGRMNKPEQVLVEVKNAAVNYVSSLWEGEEINLVYGDEEIQGKSMYLILNSVQNGEKFYTNIMCFKIK